MSREIFKFFKNFFAAANRWTKRTDECTIGVKEARGMSTVKRIATYVLVLVLLLCSTGCAEQAATDPTTAITQPPVKESLKIISFNIQTHSGGQPFFVRSEMMTEFVSEWMPDSIGMQEVTSTWRKELEATCFGEQYSSVGNAKMSTGEMNAIFYRNDKFTLVDSGTFWLSDTPDVVGSMIEGSGEPRTCTWARLKNKNTAAEFVHLNVHLDINGSAVRVKQGQALMEFVRGLGDVPMILTGDFNQSRMKSETEFYPVYQVVAALFSDARLTAPDTVSPDEWASMTRYHLEPDYYDPARQPIDYVFYTAAHFEPTVYRNIIKVRDEVFTISDHWAQYAEFTVK